MVNRVDHYNTHQGWRTDVLYWYVPACATTVDDLVRTDITDLVSGFFLNPVHPLTGAKITPVKL